MILRLADLLQHRLVSDRQTETESSTALFYQVAFSKVNNR